MCVDFDNDGDADNEAITQIINGVVYSVTTTFQKMLVLRDVGLTCVTKTTKTNVFVNLFVF